MIKQIFISLIFFSLTLFANNNFDLLRYSYIGDTQKVKETLKLHQNINTHDDEQMTSSLYAAYKNHLQTLKILVKNGADINAISHSGRNALVYAIANKNAEIVKYLLAVGIKPVVYNKDKDILYEAIESGESELVKIALPFVKDKNRYYELNSDEASRKKRVKTTLLIRAIYRGKLESVKLLLKSGAYINKPNSRGETPIMSALREQEFKMANYLLKQGSKLDGIDVQGNTVLSYAISLDQTDIALKAIEHSDLQRWFIKNFTKDKNDWRYTREWDIQKDKSDRYVYNYLHLATINNNVQVLKALLDKGMDLRVVDRIENAKLPPLAWAIKQGNYEAFKVLLDAEADPYERYKGAGQGDTPLMYFAGGGSAYTPLSFALSGEKFNPKIVKALLSLPHFENYVKKETRAFYRSVLSSAYRENPRQKYAQEVQEHFKKYGFKANTQDIVIEKKLQAKRAKRKKPTGNYYIISHALHNGDIKRIQELQKSGVNVQKIYKDAPYMAIVEGHEEMVLELLELGYDTNVSSSLSTEGLLQRFTSQGGISIGDPKIEKLFIELIKRGIDINEVNKEGITPLLYVLMAQDAREEFISRLIAMGATLGDDTRVLDALFSMKSRYKLLKIIQDPRVQKSLDILYKKADFTQIALNSMKSRKTPLSVTETLFEVAYAKNIALDYDAIYKYAKEKNHKSFFKVISFYSGDESKLWNKNLLEQYEWLVDKGEIEKALEFYLANASRLNAIKNIHNWSKAPLTLAIEYNKISYYERVINAGAIIDDRAHRNIDQLITSNDAKSLKLFAKMGMDINHVDYSGNSYFFRSVHHAEENTFMAKEILKLGYNLYNPNLSQTRVKSDINLAYRVALKKKDKKLSSMLSKLSDRSSMEVFSDAVQTKDDKLYFKGSDVLFNGKVKSDYGVYSRSRAYRDGVRHGETIVSKPNHEIFAVAYYIDAKLVSGIVMQDNASKHTTNCHFKESGEVEKCEDKVRGRKIVSSSKTISLQRVVEILKEI